MATTPAARIRCSPARPSTTSRASASCCTTERELTVGPTSDAELDAIVRQGGRRGEIYAALRAHSRSCTPISIRARFPDIPRRVSGYNLDQLLPEHGFNVARALVGTEGTCAIVLDAQFELDPQPAASIARRAGLCRRVRRRRSRSRHSGVHRPIGLEGFEGAIVDGLAPQGRAQPRPHAGGARLSARGIRRRRCPNRRTRSRSSLMERLRADARRAGRAPVHARAKQRRSGRSASPGRARPPARPRARRPLGGMGRRSRRAGEARPLPARSAQRCSTSIDYEAAYYGHFGHGCIHMQVSFDLQSEPGVRKYGEFVDRAADLVVRYGGSLSGEHGDGQSRGALLPKMFGPELMQAFREFKSAWDPDNRMNPHKARGRRICRPKTSGSAPTTGRGSPRRTSRFRTMTGRSRRRRCAASASASAASTTRARCAPATW